ncbi:MAG: TonB-dependent receptor [Pyrinomonadaceae bacterium]
MIATSVLSKQVYVRPALAFALLTFGSIVQAQTVTGIVTDAQNTSISGAAVTLRDGDRTISTTTTDERGTFTLTPNRTPALDLMIEAAGFAPYTLRLPKGLIRNVDITLQPAAARADVTVSITRTETRLNETPASVVVLTRETLDSTAAQTLDDSLRQIAGFTLFRRSSSKTSNPTAQGANLRGVSGSGVSRAAVLFDALSLNDAFGGWTFWSRVPKIAVEQAEVLRGGASPFYGDGGLSGAVNLTTPRVDELPIFRIQASAGSQNTYDGSFFAAAKKNGWAFDLAAETFQTAGYIPIAESERGLADTPANSRHNSGIFAVSKEFGEGFLTRRRRDAENLSSGRIFVRSNLFSERRDNGTSLTYNRTYFRQISGGGEYLNRAIGGLQIRAFVDTQIYDQTFSAVSADRNGETLSRLQRVPSQASGGSLSWSKLFGDHSVSASFETRSVRGFSDEVGYFAGRPTSVSGSGGTERTYSVFAYDTWRATDRLHINFGGRFDHWKNVEAHMATRTLSTNATTDLSFADRSQRAFSPRVAALYQLRSNISLYGSYSRSFRAPTLNELYRGFRVGNVVTLANENLSAERANTFEGGVNLTGIKNRFNMRGNFFVTEVSDPVVSVTLVTTPTLITRQRQNVGETRTRGIEIDAEILLRSDLRFSASCLLADSRVAEFPANSNLEGRFLPQIARQQFSLQLNYRSATRFSAGLQARVSDAQFEDDLNTLRLHPYFTMDATAAFRLRKGVEIYAAAENVFNSRYDIGLTPNRTVAAPLFVRVGLRFDLGKR